MKIADAVTPKGTVVEFQHSSISVDEIELREAFYDDMVWVFDVREPYDNSRFELGYYDDYCTFKWVHPKRSLYWVEKPLYLDIGGKYLFRVNEIESSKGSMSGWGTIGDVNKFKKFLYG